MLFSKKTKRAILLSALMAISFPLTGCADNKWNSTCDRKEFKELYKSILRSDLQSTAVFSDFLPPAPFTVYENEVVNKDNTIECSFKLETRNDGKKGDRKFYIHKSKNGEILLGTNPRDFKDGDGKIVKF